MKTVCLIASHARNDILKDCIACVLPQVSDIVLVGSSEDVDGTQGCNLTRQIAKENDLLYVDCSNIVLGKKWDAGLKRARELNPDAILICGSDDLLRHDYVESGFWDCNCWISGVDKWNVLNAEDGYELVEAKYRSRDDLIGAGRIIGSSLLDKVNWQIFPSEATGCDIFSWNIMKPHMDCQHFNSSEVLCVKGDWQMLDNFKTIANALSLSIEHKTEPEAEQYLKDNFPLIDFDKYRRKHGS